ncbi:MAG: hypothetical protein HC834_01665 [Rhodospirillales bacterium]|nr:hypothetical protein [Rhodospirillales bacterium]
MTMGIYFLTLAVLVLTSFFLVRSRAASMAMAASRQQINVHSMPLYHGLLASTLVLVAMLAVYAIGAPALSRYAQSTALAMLPAELTKDALRTGASYRDIQNIATGVFQGTPTPELQAARTPT